MLFLLLCGGVLVILYADCPVKTEVHRGRSTMHQNSVDQGIKLEEATCLDLKNPSNLNPWTLSVLFIDD